MPLKFLKSRHLQGAAGGPGGLKYRHLHGSPGKHIHDRQAHETPTLHRERKFEELRVLSLIVGQLARERPGKACMYSCSSLGLRSNPHWH